MFRIKKPLTFLAAFAGATAILFAVGPIAQDEGGGMPSLVAEQHQFLAADAGVWNAKCTLYGPQGEMSFDGKETVAVDCGGLWVFAHFDAELMGMPFSGRGVTGYDPDSKKYVGAWVDSTITKIAQLEGRMEGDALVMHTQGTDPVTGETYPEKHVHTRKGADERVFRMLAERGGEEHLMLEIVYTRAK